MNAIQTTLKIVISTKYYVRLNFQFLSRNFKIPIINGRRFYIQIIKLDFSSIQLICQQSMDSEQKYEFQVTSQLSTKQNSIKLKTCVLKRENNTKQADSQKIHLKVDKKHKTLSPSSLLRIQKIIKFQKLINSRVEQKTLKIFMIQLYKSVKYSLKSLKGAQPEIIQKRLVQLKQRVNPKQKFLFLDLDQTLMYNNEQESVSEYMNLSEVASPNKLTYQIHFRPYVFKFLDRLSQHYDIYIFTAATKSYAQAVIQKLNEKSVVIQDFLSRENCFLTKKGRRIKDLRIVKNRQLKDIVLVDNRVESFGMQIDNGIPILDFYGSKHDQELVHLEKVLVQISKAYDVRTPIRQIYNLRQLGEMTKQQFLSYVKMDSNA